MPGHKSSTGKHAHSTRRSDKKLKAAHKSKAAHKGTRRSGKGSPLRTPRGPAIDMLKNIHNEIKRYGKQLEGVHYRAGALKGRIYAQGGTNDAVKAAASSPEHEEALTDMMLQVDDELDNLRTSIEFANDDHVKPAMDKLNEMIALINDQQRQIL